MDKVGTEPERTRRNSELQDKVLHLKLINALTENDSLNIFEAITKINASPLKRVSYGSPLHLVISLSEFRIIGKVIQTYCKPTSQLATPLSIEWVNMQNEDLETPVHIASKMGRVDVLDLLFDLPCIDDTKRQAVGKTAQELAKDERTAQLFQNQVQMYIQYVTSELIKALRNDDHMAMDALFETNVRAKSYLQQGWIDINASLDAQGNSILHLASHKDNVEMVVWALKCGADPNVKNAKDKKPIDLTKSDQIKNMLRHSKTQTPIMAASLAQATSSDGHNEKEAPSLRGWIHKWTNYKDNYQPRYFVLEGGVFSYYTDEKDYPTSCRGSISTMGINAFFPDSKYDPSRFDVVGPGNVKYYLKARSAADAKKWVWNLMESRGWMTDIKGKAARFESERKTSVSLASNQDLNQIIDQVAQPTDEDSSQQFWNEDLFAYLEKHASPDFQTPELKRLLTLLKTEMKVQKETVQTTIGYVDQVGASSSEENKPAIESLLQLPKLLTASTLHIEALIFGIVRHCNRREQHWENKLKKSKEAHMRLEEVIQKISVLEPMIAEDIIEPALKPPAPKLTINTYENTDTDSDSDEFFDAQEMSSPTMGENRSLSLLSAPTTIPEEFETITTNDFLSVEEFKQSHKGYENMQVRNVLPFDPSLPMPKLAIWTFLKSAIGKDLTKLPLPVMFNEPISMLQRLCEDVEYIELLSLAARTGSKGFNPGKSLPNQPGKEAAKTLNLNYEKLENLEGDDANLLRLMFVGAFAMSNYSSTVDRTSKPFNPLLGETYELVHGTKNYRYLSEQVCHHPPISACYCESPDYAFWTEVYVKSKFWGKSLEVHPLGNSHVRLAFKDGTEHYSWKKVITLVNNLIVGTLTIEHYGDMVVKNHRTGDELVLTFKPTPGGWFGSGATDDFRALTGVVKDSKGVVRYELKGKWDNSLVAYPVTPNGFSSKPFLVWKINQLPEAWAKNFHFTNLAMHLNQTDDDLDKILPLTDSRKRPDQIAMEFGKWDVADQKKEELENIQRSARRQLVESFERTMVPSGPPNKGLEIGEKWWTPRWFIREIEKDTMEEHWKFTNDYWNIRKSEGKWPDYVLDIYGINA